MGAAIVVGLCFGRRGVVVVVVVGAATIRIRTDFLSTGCARAGRWGLGGEGATDQALNVRQVLAGARSSDPVC